MSSIDPSTFGQSVTFTATVTGVQDVPMPGGTVNFMDGVTTIGTGTLTAGHFSFAISTLAVGSHSITAMYMGDANYLTSSAALTQMVNKAATSTTVVSSLNPSVVGQSVTFTATVTGVQGVPIPTGTVNFIDGAAAIGSGTLTAGQASFAISALAMGVGSHSITAVYAGDMSYLTSTSAALTQMVNKAATSTTVVSSLNPSVVGQSVTFTAMVTGVQGVPMTGTVSFMDGATTIGTGTLTAGQTSFIISALSVGSHTITAMYTGDVNYMPSLSAPLTQNVNKAASSTALASSLNPSTFGQSVTFTATVTGSAGVTPAGTVTFKDGATTLGTVSLTAGQASFSMPMMMPGSHSIAATYSGDANYTISSGTLTQVVNQAATATTLTSSISPSTFGQSLTFPATVTGVVGMMPPMGTVTFKDGSTVLGTVTLTPAVPVTFTTSALSTGSHPITAVYSGDGNYTGSTGALTQTVNPAASATTISSAMPYAMYGMPVTYTATVTGSGGRCVADRRRHVQGRRDHAGQRHSDGSRGCSAGQLYNQHGVNGRQSLDHRGLRGQRQLQREHLVHPEPDGQSGHGTDDADSLCELGSGRSAGYIRA